MGGRNGGDAERMREARARARQLRVPAVADPERRARCEADDELWLRTYLPEVFYSPFVPFQRRILRDAADCLHFGSLKCTAAPRGGGKSTCLRYKLLKDLLTRRLRFPLIIAATSTKARDFLDSIKRRLASPPSSPLAQDYPLECTIGRYVNPWPSRARNVVANDRRINVEWGPDHFILPTWEDEEPLGPICMALGITSDDIQGCNIYDQRPDFVLLDDLDSRDSLAAENGRMAAKICESIDKTVGGLRGQAKRLGMYYTCTITSLDSAAYKFSDPLQKPAWGGSRIKAIDKWPDRMDLWDRYVELRQYGQSTLGADGLPLDRYGREAHRFYESNRESMDAGAAVANEHNYIAQPTPDGTPEHLSALQACFDFIADYGMESFQTEYQNDPQKDESVAQTQLTARRVQSQVNGYEWKIVPPGCALITQGIDVRKSALHYVVRAFADDGSAYHTLHYGIEEVHGTSVGTDKGLDEALIRALKSRMEHVREEGYMTADGEILPVAFTLVDAGWRTDAIYRACRELGVGIMPSMGFGRSAGCAKPNFSPGVQRTDTRIPGDGWFMSLQQDGTWLVACDADRWKVWEHDRWLTSPEQPGAMFLYGDPAGIVPGGRMTDTERRHLGYAKHLCAEAEVEEVVRGQLVRRIKQFSENNHWLDASYLSTVAAKIKGATLIARGSRITAPPPAAPSRPPVPAATPRTERAAVAPPLSVSVDPAGRSFLASGR